MPHEFERGPLQEVGDVPLPPSEKVVETDHFVAVIQEALTEVGSKEAGTAGD
jgi:hypothetical protein